MEPANQVVGRSNGAPEKKYVGRTEHVLLTLIAIQARITVKDNIVLKAWPVAQLDAKPTIVIGNDSPWNKEIARSRRSKDRLKCRWFRG